MPAAMPKSAPTVIEASARVRQARGAVSLKSATEGEEPAASPMPTPIRARKRCVKFIATPPTAVIRLQTKSPAATTLRRA